MLHPGALTRLCAYIRHQDIGIAKCAVFTKSETVDTSPSDFDVCLLFVGWKEIVWIKQHLSSVDAHFDNVHYEYL